VGTSGDDTVGGCDDDDLEAYGTEYRKLLAQGWLGGGFGDCSNSKKVEDFEEGMRKSSRKQ
jgi:hypothetical protein